MNELKVKFVLDTSDLDAQSEAIMAKLGSKFSAGHGPKISFEKWLDAGSEYEKAGEKIGSAMGDGIAKGVQKKASLSLDALTKAHLKTVVDTSKWWDDAVKRGASQNPVATIGRLQGPDLSGAMRASLLQGALQGPDLSGSMRAALLKGSLQGPDLFGDMRWKSATMGGMQGPDLSGKMRENAMAKIASDMHKSQLDSASYIKNMSLLVGPIMNPGSPLTTMFAGRQAFSALMTSQGQSQLGRFGLSGTGGAMAGAAALMAGATAVGAAFVALKDTLKGVIESYETARQLYAKSLQSGLGLGMTTRLGMQSSILGVPESEVRRFGAALSYVNPKIEWASQVLAKTTPNLTSVSWEFKILQQNLAATFATLANDAAPAIRSFVSAISDLTIRVTQLYNLLPKGLIGGMATGVSSAAFGGMATGYGRAIMGLLGLAGNSGAAPTPLSQMAKLPTSAWEKMGLVIGGTQENYQRDIARNTREMANGIKAIVNHTMGIGRGRGSSIWNPAFASP